MALKIGALKLSDQELVRQNGPQRELRSYRLPFRGAKAAGALDCAIALTYLELAAEARGLGVCWAGFLTRAAGAHAPLRQALSVPEGYAVRGALMLGLSKYVYQRIPPRNPLRVHWL